ncbi:MAG: metallophosphoesterase family protein [Candidatus Izemoplasmatales bacterium]|jgi:putative phosphoesterase
MRFIVFSDNHRNREYLKKMLTDNPDIKTVISLGDSEMNEAELTSMGIFGVKGNYPFDPRFPLELILEFEGFRFLFVHGHLFNVKNTLSQLKEKASSVNADVVFYGHTHASRIHEDHDLVFINPGALGTPYGAYLPSYAIVEANDSCLRVKIISAIDNAVVNDIKRTKTPRRER